MTPKDRKAFEEINKRVATPRVFYAEHPQIAMSAFPTRYIFVRSGVVHDQEHAIHPLRVAITQNECLWERMGCRDHGGFATKRSSDIAHIRRRLSENHQDWAFQISSTQQDVATSLDVKRLLYTVSIQLPGDMYRTEAGFWKEWHDAHSKTLVLHAETLQYSREQLAPSNDLRLRIQDWAGRVLLRTKAHPTTAADRTSIAIFFVAQVLKCSTFGTFPSITHSIRLGHLKEWVKSALDDDKILELQDPMDEWSVSLNPRSKTKPHYSFDSEICARLVEISGRDPKVFWLKQRLDAHTGMVTLIVCSTPLTCEMSARIVSDSVPGTSVLVVRSDEDWKPSTIDVDASHAGVMFRDLVGSPRVVVKGKKRIPDSVALSDVEHVVFLECTASPDDELSLVQRILEHRGNSRLVADLLSIRPVRCQSGCHLYLAGRSSRPGLIDCQDVAEVIFEA
jgi:hypothetical protein